MDIRDALKMWINNKIGDYKLPLNNLTKDFHDGMIFNALVHRMRPKLVDYAALKPAQGPKNLLSALYA